jgi:hypothetical protein
MQCPPLTRQAPPGGRAKGRPLAVLPGLRKQERPLAPFPRRMGPGGCDSPLCYARTSRQDPGHPLEREMGPAARVTSRPGPEVPARLATQGQGRSIRTSIVPSPCWFVRHSGRESCPLSACRERLRVSSVRAGQLWHGCLLRQSLTLGLLD